VILRTSPRGPRADARVASRRTFHLGGSTIRRLPDSRVRAGAVPKRRKRLRSPEPRKRLRIPGPRKRLRSLEKTAMRQHVTPQITSGQSRPPTGLFPLWKTGSG
jgi:hypothetical protein